MKPGERCLMCGQVAPGKPSRICGSCGKPIGKGHKFYFDSSTVRHRHCDNPTEYHPREQGPATR